MDHTGMGCDGAAGASTAGCMRTTIIRVRRMRNETTFFMMRTILSASFSDHNIACFAISNQQHFAVISTKKHYILYD
jgi:hypothetical protein